jgi:2-dehydro-3-deoxygalactonokinase
MLEHLLINVDWGTSHCRLRAVVVDGVEIIAEYQSNEGVAQLAEHPEQFRAVLTSGLSQLQAHCDRSLDGAPVLISGMASSTIGWQELPYARLPLRLDGSDLVWRDMDPIGPSAQRVVLISGARGDIDVVRGEETQAIGIFQLPAMHELGDRSLLILPGTHSKHLRVERKSIVEFRTFMTGELFHVLGKHSTLRHSITAVDDHGPTLAGDQLAAFASGVELARQLPLPAALFRVRTRQVLDGLGRDLNRAFFSGLLIGSELATLTVGSEYEGWPIVLAGAQPLAAHYRAALDVLGLHDRIQVIPDSDVCRLSALGQAVLWRRVRQITA